MQILQKHPDLRNAIETFSHWNLFDALIAEKKSKFYLGIYGVSSKKRLLDDIRFFTKLVTKIWRVYLPLQVQ